MDRLLLQVLTLAFVSYNVRAIDKACPYKPIDIVFVLDGSGSEGLNHFNKQLRFVRNITSQFEIGENHTRVSLVTFSTHASNEILLNQYYNKTQLLRQIMQTKYPGGETNTHHAIHALTHNTLLPKHGAERNVTKLVIVLTDGRSSDPTKLQQEINTLKTNPLVTTIAVGIGKAVDPRELQMIASDSNHTFQIGSFDALHTLQNDLTDTACRASCRKGVSNVCFVLDSSGSEGAINFHKQLEFVNTVVNQFRFKGPGRSRVCLITYSNHAHNEIQLTQYHDKNTLMTNVLKVPWRNGETMTNKGLDAARHQLNQVHGSKVAIVLTDGKSSVPALTKTAADRLHSLGIETFAVGIGHHVDNKELQVIASDNDHVFKVGTFNQLANIHQTVVNRMCAYRHHQQTSHHVTDHVTNHVTKHVTHHPTHGANTHSPKHATTKAKTTTKTTTTTTSTSTLPTATTKHVCSLKPADIAFVIDASENQGVDNVKTAVDFVHDLASRLSRDVPDVHFSSASFSSNVRNDFFFNKYQSSSYILQAVRNIQYMGFGTNTSGALNFVRTQTLLPANGARTNSKKVVIVVTNGHSDNPDQTKHEAELLQKQADVISVGIPPIDDQSELDNIASNHLGVSANITTVTEIIKSQLMNLDCQAR